ncbi:hypothetical protein CXB51_010780 [Gossypium anomalum]|uniref:Uncharacterized protein n=1 Tax=Gossypium anomalum TaxID=47600 RepID=A0A8J5YV39_9ROSI|nr:hypothetical protein CXB51_010780 [Gossypium anomalum]
MSGWPRYPPCASGTCTDVVCCAHEVTAEILTSGRVGPPNFCCNRVFVIVDTHSNVTNIPTIG